MASNSAVHWPIAIKFGTVMQHRTAELLKFTFDQNKSCLQHPYFCKIKISASTPLAFKLPASFRNGARYLNSETNASSKGDRSMSSLRLIKFDPRTSESRR